MTPQHTSAVACPANDPAPVFEYFRAGFASNLLIAAVAHFRLFEKLEGRSLTHAELAAALGLEDRPAVVLLTALRAMGLIIADTSGRLSLSTPGAEQLTPGSYFSIADYLGLAADTPAVLELVERLRANRTGTAFVYKETVESPMEEEASARNLTLALAGRAKNVAPVLADRLPLGNGTLLDIGGGTGIYSIALLQKNPGLRAIILDRPEVLRVAAEFATQYGVADRLELRPGDMFTAAFPPADSVLFSNVLHDWDVDDCRGLVRRAADCLRPGGSILIHDVLLNDALDGPLAVACYSAQLFTMAEGRAYSAAEYTAWLREAGLQVQPPIPTLAHCHVIRGGSGR
ncbi:MAG TPA: methyltransferase [Bryobacteraceae bacterium]|nr:methyltransferase [Bryobacteraceae bacterium]